MTLRSFSDIKDLVKRGILVWNGTFHYPQPWEGESAQSLEEIEKEVLEKMNKRSKVIEERLGSDSFILKCADAVCFNCNTKYNPYNESFPNCPNCGAQVFNL
jgi:hypothetical protein